MDPAAQKTNAIEKAFFRIYQEWSYNAHDLIEAGMPRVFDFYTSRLKFSAQEVASDMALGLAMLSLTKQELDREPEVLKVAEQPNAMNVLSSYTKGQMRLKLTDAEFEAKLEARTTELLLLGGDQDKTGAGGAAIKGVLTVINSRVHEGSMREQLKSDRLWNPVTKLANQWEDRVDKLKQLAELELEKELAATMKELEEKLARAIVASLSGSSLPQSRHVVEPSVDGADE